MSSLNYFVSYKQRIICYLLSHVTCCAHLPLKLSLLRSLEQVSSPAKPQVLLPVAEKMAADDELTKRDSDSEAFVSLVLASLDGSSINTLNERSGKPWATYVKIVQSFFGPGMHVATSSTGFYSALYRYIAIRQGRSCCLSSRRSLQTAPDRTQSNTLQSPS